MTDTTTLDNETLLAKLKELAAPFPEQAIGKLPRITCKDCSDKKCQRHQKQRCEECGNWITPQHVHLDYVGHAWVTDRLNAVDPFWNWEPVANPAELGLPVAQGGLWIKLTVLGVSRYGFGDAEGKKGPDSVKQLIGDALRNAAMRFGVALDLWKKDRHASTDSSSGSSSQSNTDDTEPVTADEFKEVVDLARALPENLKDSLKTWLGVMGISMKWGELTRPGAALANAYISGMTATSQASSSVTQATQKANPATDRIIGDGVTDDTKAMQAAVDRDTRVNKAHLDTLTGLVGQLTDAQKAGLKKWRYTPEVNVTGSPETWTVARWNVVMAEAKRLIDNKPIDLEFRGWLGARLADLGPEYEQVFQEHLDGLEANPEKGRPWRQQMDRIPTSFDDEMREVIDMLVEQHTKVNPPKDKPVPDGGEAF